MHFYRVPFMKSPFRDQPAEPAGMVCCRHIRKKDRSVGPVTLPVVCKPFTQLIACIQMGELKEHLLCLMQ